MVSNLRLVPNTDKMPASSQNAAEARGPVPELAEATRTAVLYTIALNVFRQYGPSLASYAAFQKAVLRNPHVAVRVASQMSETAISVDGTTGSAAEASDYVACASLEWAQVVGATAYLLEVQSDLEAQIQARGLYQVGN
jgi:hypothetical protein